jgi:chemotaxis signal transduction protein
MTLANHIDPQLLALRAEFDRSFAEAATADRPDQLDVLTIRIAGDPYAFRLAEIQSLQLVRKLVAAPSLLPALLGMAGFRGVLTPIYDLGQLLGYAAEPAPKWLVVVQNQAPIGLAFATLDAHLRVPKDCVSAPVQGSSAVIAGAVKAADRVLPLLHLPSLVEELAHRIKAFGSSQER